jgi:hypothetical protein
MGQRAPREGEQRRSARRSGNDARHRRRTWRWARWTGNPAEFRAVRGGSWEEKASDCAFFAGCLVLGTKARDLGAAHGTNRPPKSKKLCESFDSVSRTSRSVRRSRASLCIGTTEFRWVFSASFNIRIRNNTFCSGQPHQMEEGKQPYQAASNRLINTRVLLKSVPQLANSPDTLRSLRSLRSFCPYGGGALEVLQRGGYEWAD